MAEARIWHTEQKTQDCKEYYGILADDEKTVSFILKHNAATNEIQVEPYSPPDIDYTIHDGCNHEEGECFEDYPDSWQAQECAMADWHAYYIRQLLAFEHQVKQTKIADELRNAKAKIEYQRLKGEIW